MKQSAPVTRGVLSFCDFVKTFFDVTMTPAQRVVGKICVDGRQISELTVEEQELAVKLFKCTPDKKIPRIARRNICLLFGRGSGKSSFGSWLAIYKAFTSDVTKCGKGDTPTVAFIAPDRATAKEVGISMVFANLADNPKLSKYIVSKDENEASVTIKRPDGREVLIKAFAASKSGRTVRGRSLIAVIFDEAQHFNSGGSAGYVVNDKDMYEAVTPRLLPGGSVLFISTPWPSENIMSDYMEKNLGDPRFALCAIAPTLLMRPDRPDVAESRAIMMEHDPINAAREYDCDINGFSVSNYFSADCIQESIDEELDVTPNPKFPTVAAADFGFKHDSSTLCIVQWDGRKYKLVRLVEISPKKGKALIPSEVVAEFAAHIKEFGCVSVLSDGYQEDSIQEHLRNHELNLDRAPYGVSGKMMTHTRAKAVLHEGWCALPNNKRLIRQMCQLVARPTQGGMMQFKSPRRIGEGHGDLVSSWILAIYGIAHYHVRADKGIKGRFADESYGDYISRKQRIRDAAMEASDLKDAAREATNKPHWR